jgi:hypothetical protein
LADFSLQLFLSFFIYCEIQTLFPNFCADVGEVFKNIFRGLMSEYQSLMVAAALHCRSSAHRFAEHTVEVISSLLSDVSLEEIDVFTHKSNISSILILFPVMGVVFYIAAYPKFTLFAFVKPRFEPFRNVLLLLNDHG